MLTLGRMVSTEIHVWCPGGAAEGVQKGADKAGEGLTRLLPCERSIREHAVGPLGMIVAPLVVLTMLAPSALSLAGAISARSKSAAGEILPRLRLSAGLWASSMAQPASGGEVLPAVACESERGGVGAGRTPAVEVSERIAETCAVPTLVEDGHVPSSPLLCILLPASAEPPAQPTACCGCD